MDKYGSTQITTNFIHAGNSGRVPKPLMESAEIFRFMNGNLDGISTKYFPDGKVECVKNYIYGMLFGKLCEFSNKGVKLTSCNYVNGVIHGLFQTWNHEGIIRGERNYDNGVLHGDYFIWDRTGIVELEAHYVNGNLHGDYIERYGMEGWMKAEGHYVNGKKQGEFKKWHSTRGISTQLPYSIAEYDNDELHGKETEFYKGGSVASVTYYSRGSPIGYSIRYNEDGTVCQLSD
jgi:uncharacterized protein